MKDTDIYDAVEKVETKDDLVKFVSMLSADFENRRDEWENQSLDHYFEVIGHWVSIMDNLEMDFGKDFPRYPSWKTLAQILLAPRAYE